MRYLRNLWHKFFTSINISYLFINIGNIPIMTIDIKTQNCLDIINKYKRMKLQQII